jgi:hypothetical protein
VLGATSRLTWQICGGDEPTAPCRMGSTGGNCSFEPWPALLSSLQHCTVAGALNLVTRLDPTRPSCDLASLLDFLLQPHRSAVLSSAPLSSCSTNLDTLPRPLRANLLCLLSLVVPRLPVPLLRRVLTRVLEQHQPTDDKAQLVYWDTRIASELLFQLDRQASSATLPLAGRSHPDYEQLCERLRLTRG